MRTSFGKMVRILLTTASNIFQAKLLFLDWPFLCLYFISSHSKMLHFIVVVLQLNGFLGKMASYCYRYTMFNTNESESK